MSTDSNTTSPLLALPAELRNRIYELVLIKEVCIEVIIYCIDGCIIKELQSQHLANRVQQPPLTRTCRQLREESLSIFYTGNVFLIRRSNGDSHLDHGSHDDEEPLVRWLSAIGAEKRSWLRQFYHPARENKDGLCGSLLRAFGDSATVMLVPERMYVESGSLWHGRLWNEWEKVSFSKLE